MKYQKLTQLQKDLKSDGRLNPIDHLKIGFNVEDYFKEKGWAISVNSYLDTAFDVAEDMEEIHRIASTGYLSDSDAADALKSILEIFTGEQKSRAEKEYEQKVTENYWKNLK